MIAFIVLTALAVYFRYKEQFRKFNKKPDHFPRPFITRKVMKINFLEHAFKNSTQWSNFGFPTMFQRYKYQNQSSKLGNYALFSPACSSIPMDSRIPKINFKRRPLRARVNQKLPALVYGHLKEKNEGFPNFPKVMDIRYYLLLLNTL